jgi:hypothetical protein
MLKDLGTGISLIEALNDTPQNAPALDIEQPQALPPASTTPETPIVPVNSVLDGTQDFASPTGSEKDTKEDTDDYVDRLFN